MNPNGFSMLYLFARFYLIFMAHISWQKKTNTKNKQKETVKITSSATDKNHSFDGNGKSVYCYGMEVLELTFPIPRQFASCHYLIIRYYYIQRGL